MLCLAFMFRMCTGKSNPLISSAYILRTLFRLKYTKMYISTIIVNMSNKMRDAQVGGDRVTDGG